MIIRGGMSEILYYQRLRDLGMPEEYFFSLPYECQKAIMMAGFDKLEKEKRKENAQKKRALRQYEFEERVKEKVLTLIKRKK